MKALVYTGTRRVEMQTAPDPSPAPNEALVRVSATGICGSDMAGFLGLSARRKPPLVLGHEAVGAVVQMPSAPRPHGGEWPFAVGRRAVVNPLFPCGACAACRAGKPNICSDWSLLGMDRRAGAFAAYVAVPAANIVPIPDDLPDHRAAMIEPLANGVHIFGLISGPRFGSLVIFGAGTQGILLVRMARLLGYRDIVSLDVNPLRLETAKEMGARHALDVRSTDPIKAVRELFPDGADTVIEAHGEAATRSAAVQVVRKGGEVILLGLLEATSAIDFNLVVRNEIRLQGSFAYTPDDFARSERLIATGDVDLSRWTMTRPMEDGQAAFDLMADNPGATLKVVLTL
jgi:2-desacetyl-2-hydroxyethyl bacteriochlorophyllide A dehydrogenase